MRSRRLLLLPLLALFAATRAAAQPAPASGAPGDAVRMEARQQGQVETCNGYYRSRAL